MYYITNIKKEIYKTSIYNNCLGTLNLLIRKKPFLYRDVFNPIELAEILCKNHDLISIQLINISEPSILNDYKEYFIKYAILYKKTIIINWILCTFKNIDIQDELIYECIKLLITDNIIEKIERIFANVNINNILKLSVSNNAKDLIRYIFIFSCNNNIINIAEYISMFYPSEYLIKITDDKIIFYDYQYLFCPICYSNELEIQKLCTKFIKTSCDHLFCKICIKSWQQKSNLCPICKQVYKKIE